MAVLPPEELALVRRNSVNNGVLINVTKIILNAAIQTCEDYFENTARGGLEGSIEAVAAGTFDATQKAQIIKHWLESKYRRGL